MGSGCRPGRRRGERYRDSQRTLRTQLADQHAYVGQFVTVQLGHRRGAGRSTGTTDRGADQLVRDAEGVDQLERMLGQLLAEGVDGPRHGLRSRRRYAPVLLEPTAVALDL